MRPSTFVSSTSRSALSSLASSLARLSLSWNPLDLSCRLRWRLGTKHWFAGVFRHRIGSTDIGAHRAHIASFLQPQASAC